MAAFTRVVKNALMTAKNSAAVEHGHRGGGKARARKLTPQRREAARKAVQARWAKQRHLTQEINEGSGNLSSELPKPMPARRV